MLKLFVYGTLKRGFSNHARFCRNFLSVEPAVVLGRLFVNTVGIPLLEVPVKSILACGSADPLADTTVQAQAATRIRENRGDAPFRPDDFTGEFWTEVHGELFTFDDPATRLPALDRLEEFNPSGPSVYRRLLVPVRVNGSVVPAWLFAAGDRRAGQSRALAGGAWP